MVVARGAVKQEARPQQPPRTAAGSVGEEQRRAFKEARLPAGLRQLKAAADRALQVGQQNHAGCLISMNGPIEEPLSCTCFCSNDRSD